MPEDIPDPRDRRLTNDENAAIACDWSDHRKAYGSDPDPEKHGRDFRLFCAGWDAGRRSGVSPLTVEEWAAAMDAERVRQIERGYDDAHDVAHGPAHLLNWAIEYARRGKTLAAATMMRSALRLILGSGGSES